MSQTILHRRFAPAKINLFLHVGDKRPDGYHELMSLAVFADVGDWLSAKASAATTLSVTGPFAPALANESDSDNLVLRAAAALSAWAAKHGFGARAAELSLEKNLPIASGIGGGSSDAAAALLLLATLWALPIPIDDLREIGLTLGADVPVCVNAQPSFMSGIGEILGAAPNVPEFALLLVNPGVAVPTSLIFKGLRTRTGAVPPKAFAGTTAHDFALWLDQFGNDLAPPAIGLAPVITRVEAAITASQGCLLARMSGSGATCFGMFATLSEAQTAAHAIATEHPQWWVKAAQTFSRSD